MIWKMSTALSNLRTAIFSNSCLGQHLPEGWRAVRLGDIADVGFSSVDKKSMEGELPVRLCNYTDVFYNRRIRTAMQFMNATATQSECERWNLKQGDILFTKDSETPAEIGIPAYVTETMPGVLCGYHLGLARPNAAVVDGAYLADAFGSRSMARQFARIANGITRFGLTLRATNSLPIPLPPLPEQRAIANILDSIDHAIEATGALVSATEQFRDSLLHNLLTHGLPGRHTEWKEVPGLGTIPSDWQAAHLGSHSERITKGTTPTTLGQKYTLSGVRFLRVENISNGGTISGGGLRFIDEETHHLLSRSILKDNDLLFSIAGALGRSALISSNILPANVNQALAIVRLGDRSAMLPAFLSQVLRGQSVQVQVNDMRTELAQANISLQQVGDLLVPLPPRSEQQAIVDILDSADDSIEKEFAAGEGLRKLKESASDALLTGRVRTITKLKGR